MKIICYLSSGYPTLADSNRLAKEYVAAGCDIIEIDIPSRNPYLESNYISNRMKHSLQMCENYDKYLENFKTLKIELPSTKFVLVVYEETILEIGVQKFIVFCTNNDYKDIILVGIKHQELKSVLIKKWFVCFLLCSISSP